MITDYGGWSIEVSTIYMMSICKFSGIAFSYEDGAVMEQDLKDQYIRSK